MTEIDLAAIRARDAKWTGGTRKGQQSPRDRRDLLEYIDELESIMVEIAADITVIRRVQREHYMPKPVDPAALETFEAKLGVADGRNFHAASTSGKLPP